MAEEAEAPATEEPPAPTPTWRPFVASIVAPEEYGLDPLLASAAEVERFSVVDVAEVAKAAAGDLATEIKAWEAEHPGEELDGSLMAKALLAKVDEDRAAGILKKQEPPPEAAEEPPAPAEPEEGAPPPLPAPPDPETSADVYYVLKGFPRTAADVAAMAAAGLPLDAMLTLAMDRAALASSQSAAPAEAAPTKGGKGAPPPPAEAEEAEPEAPDDTPLPTPALTLELGASAAAAGDTVMTTCDGIEAAAWAQPQAVMGRVASVAFAAARKKVMWDEFNVPLKVVSVGVAAEPADDTHYRKLMAGAPPGVGVAYVLHAVVEQVARSCADGSDAAAAAAEAALDDMGALLAADGAALGRPPKSLAQQAAEAAAVASGASAVVPARDGVPARALIPAAYGTGGASAQARAAQAAAEAALYAGLPLPGKARREMPAAPSLTTEERGVERTELHHYSKFSPPLIDASMQLRTAAAAVNAADAHRGTADGTGWLLSDRLWSEELTPEVLAQVLTAARASSLRPLELAAYHARDELLLLALHKPVPESRESVDTWRCAVHDRVSRRFGEWAAWLGGGGGGGGGGGSDAAAVPRPPLPPSGGALYALSDPGCASLLTTQTTLYPVDHMIVGVTNAAAGASCTIGSLAGFYARLWRASGAPVPAGLDAAPAELALTFGGGEVGTRALAGYDAAFADMGGGWRLAVGGDDGQEAALTTAGVASLAPAPPPFAGPSEPPRSPAATLTLTAVKASGVPEADGAGAPLPELYVRVTVAEASDDTAAATAAAPAAAAMEWEGEVLRLALEEGGARPPTLLVSLWDKDFMTGEPPLASLELQLPADAAAAGSGEVASLALTARADLTLPDGTAISLSFAWALATLASADPGESNAPPPREKSRLVLPSGSVVRSLDDGSLTLYTRNGNAATRAASGPHAGCWVSTNSAGLRMGERGDGSTYYVPPVAVASSTDPETHVVVTTRADGTLVLVRDDGSRLVQFADGTTIESSADAEKYGNRGEVVVACDGVATVTSNLKSAEVSVAMLDGTRLMRNHLSVMLGHVDGTALALSDGGKAELRPPALAAVERLPEDVSGVYALQLATGEVGTTDGEGNRFEVVLGGKHTVELVLKDDLAGDTGADGVAGGSSSAADAPDDPSWCHPPRLFVCRPDGSGAELLRHADVRPFLKARAEGVEAGVGQVEESRLPADAEALAATHVWRDAQTVRNGAAAAAAAASEARTLLAMLPKVDVPAPTATLLHHRRLVKREPLNPSERAVLEKELASMDAWRAGEEEKATELHVEDTRTPEEKAAEAKVQAMLAASGA